MTETRSVGIVPDNKTHYGALPTILSYPQCVPDSQAVDGVTRNNPHRIFNSLFLSILYPLPIP